MIEVNDKQKSSATVLNVMFENEKIAMTFAERAALDVSPPAYQKEFFILESRAEA